jgi:vacuolar-type H+-ATPase subunit I/STV1
MKQSSFIPSGRTSRLVKGSVELQIQTEYAQWPNPRLTTSVISSGQVINKIQQDLPAPIATEKEKNRVEELLRQQHFEVIKILKGKRASLELSAEDSRKIETRALSLKEELSRIKGVERVYRLDNDGHFVSANLSEELREAFAEVFKSLNEILDIFSRLPNGRREAGVCEIERGRLYLVSSGQECYFLLAEKNQSSATIERKIASVLKGK